MLSGRAGLVRAPADDPDGIFKIIKAFSHNETAPAQAPVRVPGRHAAEMPPGIQRIPGEPNMPYGT
jgi:hypothetical protein